MNDPTQLDVKAVHVLIVVALSQELAAVHAAMASYQRIGVDEDPNTYSIGYFIHPEGAGDPRSVIVCQSGMGNNNAATTATDALRSFPNISHIIMCGIAGGCPNPNDAVQHVRLGDIVYSDSSGILEYDFVKEDATGRTGRSYPQQPSGRMLGVINTIMAEAILDIKPWETEIDAIVEKAAFFARPKAGADILYDLNGKRIRHPRSSVRKGRPRVHGGAIGTADTLQKNPVMRDELRDQFRVRAIEMEAGGMRTAAWVRDQSIMVVRGICDYCDSYKNDAWQAYASAVAAAFTKVLVLGMPSEWFPKLPAPEVPVLHVCRNEMGSHQDPVTKAELAKAVRILLAKNRSIFQAFGPTSHAAHDPSSNAHAIWELRRKDSIVPNNRSIVNLIKANENLLGEDQLEAYADFCAHAEAYEAHVYSPVDTYPTFPENFEDAFRYE